MDGKHVQDPPTHPTVATHTVQERVVENKNLALPPPEHTRPNLETRSITPVQAEVQSETSIRGSLVEMNPCGGRKVEERDLLVVGLEVWQLRVYQSRQEALEDLARVWRVVGAYASMQLALLIGLIWEVKRRTASYVTIVEQHFRPVPGLPNELWTVGWGPTPRTDALQVLQDARVASF